VLKPQRGRSEGLKWGGGVQKIILEDNILEDNILVSGLTKISNSLRLFKELSMLETEKL